MYVTGLDGVRGLLLVQHELLLFAAIFFLIGALDELAVDVLYFWMRATGRIATRRVDASELALRRLTGRAAIFVPCWQEAPVIGATLRHALAVWPDEGLRFYVGCYRDDPETRLAAERAAGADLRVRIVINDVDGPTSKADCLNRLYEALEADESKEHCRFRMVVLHDAEDMVDPLAIAAMDAALRDAEFVQLPVLALPKPGSPFIAGHYVDEFAEAHAKTMPVRDALGVGIPGAGVGCAVEREILARLAQIRSGNRPFADDSLTEDYEFGLGIAAMGGRTRFLRLRTKEGRLIATRAYFPGRIGQSVRQKTRWVHGIALQGWDRLGWSGGIGRTWMELRDRRGPLLAVLLLLAYVLVILIAISWAAEAAGLLDPMRSTATIRILLFANVLALIWRAALRAVFTAREFGWREGLLAIARIPVSNVIAIMAGRRAIAAYVRALRGAEIHWEKTEHREHPSIALGEGASR